MRKNRLYARRGYR